MIDIDREVRDSLTRQSAYAPDGFDLLAGVHGRSRRYAKRRRIVLGGVAAAVAVLVAVPLLGQFGRGTSALQPAGGRSEIELVPAAPSADRFPLTPGWLPDGLLPPQVIRQSSDEVTLQYPVEPGPIEPALVINVTRSDISKYEVNGAQVKYGRRPTNIGKPAELLTVPDFVEETALTFQRAPQQWVFITARRGIGTDAVLRRVAANLRDAPIAGTMPFEFKLGPKGFTLGQTSEVGAGFQPPKGVRQENALLVWVEPFNLESFKQLGADRRHVAKQDGRYTADILIEGGWVLRISAPAEPALSRSDFLRFVDGVTIRPDLKPRRG
jgi:hypothetical protein